MSKQTEFLHNLIEAVRQDPAMEAPVLLLRECVEVAGRKAPVEDLLLMADRLLEIGERLSREDERDRATLN